MELPRDPPLFYTTLIDLPVLSRVKSRIWDLGPSQFQRCTLVTVRYGGLAEGGDHFLSKSFQSIAVVGLGALG